MSTKSTRSKHLLVIARIIATKEGYVGSLTHQCIDTSTKRLEGTAKHLLAQMVEWPTYTYLPLITKYGQPGAADDGYRDAVARAKRRVDETVAKMNQRDYHL